MEPVKKLAKERKKAMAKLIQKDPKEAIKHAVRPFEKAGLPAEVQVIRKDRVYTNTHLPRPRIYQII
jgi:hypothetical protein